MSLAWKQSGETSDRGVRRHRSFARRLRNIAVASLGALCVASAMAAAQPSTQPSVPVSRVDFDVALRGVRFDPATADGNLDGTGAANGMLDAVEMALVAAVLNDATQDLSEKGGIDHATARAAYDQARLSASRDVAPLSRQFPSAAEMVTGYVMIGERGSFDAINKMLTGFGAPLSGDYSLALGLGRYFGANGDADGDGFTNRAEHDAFIEGGRQAFVRAALDPEARPDPAQAQRVASPVRSGKKTIGIVLYPGFEVLDVYGPLEMWANVPEFDVIVIAERAGPVVSAQGAATLATYAFADAPHLDIIMVPGGFGTRAQLENETFLEFLRARDKEAEFTTSVCTGSALLARAGILDGRRATSNKAFFSLAQENGPRVRWEPRARWVEDGRFITSSGVSAGTDMALALVARIHGRERARRLARSLEYRWNEDPRDDPFAVSLR